MADRSTAAVGVAHESGDAPLTAQQDGATSDGTTGQTTPPEDARPGPGQNGRSQDSGQLDGRKQDSASPEGGRPPKGTPQELHSGHRLARRYQLEECLTRVDGFSSWRAVDEKLRRAVGIHLLPAEHPRARQVLAAARSAALLGDPRFVQVLDAVEENDLVYVIHEWLPDATSLAGLLSTTPLEPHDAYQMASQVSQAMAAAHREGLAHLRLDPGAVLRTGSGQYRIRGLAVTAALRGLKSDRPQRQDTEAIGALLYASLTQRWPYEHDTHGLGGLPKGAGLVAPDQVRAGVHRGLSDLAMRALANDGATASSQDPACTTPEELAKAVASVPRIRPPEPDFTPAPQYQRTTYQQGPYQQGAHHAQSTAASESAAMASTPPPALPGRTGKALKWAVAALVIAAIGLASWEIADTLVKRQHETQGEPAPPKSGDTTTTTVAEPLRIQGATEFTPLAGPIQGDQVALAVDGNPTTSWVTAGYTYSPNFGNLSQRAQGGGIIVDLGSTQDVSKVDVRMSVPGQTVELLAAPAAASGPSTLADFTQRITPARKSGAEVYRTLDHPVKTRYVLVHITELPLSATDGKYRGGITDIKVFGGS